MNNIPDSIQDLVDRGVVDEDVAKEVYSGEPRTMAGLPVITDNADRLAFQNPRSGSDSIHISKIETSSNYSIGYGWSVCENGSSRGKTEKNSLYISPDEFNDKYIERDGEIVGKLCGNCKRQL